MTEKETVNNGPGFSDASAILSLEELFSLCRDADKTLLMQNKRVQECPDKIRKEMKFAISDRYFMAGLLVRSMMSAVPVLRQREFPFAIGTHRDLLKNADITKIILDGPSLDVDGVPLSPDALIKHRINRFLSIRTKDNDYLAALIRSPYRMGINGDTHEITEFQRAYAKARLYRKLEKRLIRGQTHPELYLKLYGTSYEQDFGIKV